MTRHLAQYKLLQDTSWGFRKSRLFVYVCSTLHMFRNLSRNAFVWVVFQIGRNTTPVIAPQDWHSWVESHQSVCTINHFLWETWAWVSAMKCRRDLIRTKQLPTSGNTQTQCSYYFFLVNQGVICPPLKPDSHVPSTILATKSRYCLGYCSDIRIEVASNRDHPSLYRRHACEVYSSSTS